MGMRISYLFLTLIYDADFYVNLKIINSGLLFAMEKRTMVEIVSKTILVPVVIIAFVVLWQCIRAVRLK